MYPFIHNYLILSFKHHYSKISPVTNCRIFGVLFDSGLKMEYKVKSAAKSAFYHLKLISRIRNFLYQP